MKTTYKSDELLPLTQHFSIPFWDHALCFGAQGCGAQPRQPEWARISLCTQKPHWHLYSHVYSTISFCIYNSEDICVFSCLFATLNWAPLYKVFPHLRLKVAMKIREVWHDEGTAVLGTVTLLDPMLLGCSTSLQGQNQLKMVLFCWMRYWVAFWGQQTETASHAAQARAEERNFDLQLHEEKSFTSLLHGTKGAGHNQNLNTGTFPESQRSLSRKIRCWCPFTINGQVPRSSN